MDEKTKDFMMKTLFSGMSMEETHEEAAKRFHCTLCGKPFDFWDVQEGLGFKYWMGFGSKYDGEHIKMSFCIRCFDELIDELAPKCVDSPFISGMEYASDGIDSPSAISTDDMNDLYKQLHEVREDYDECDEEDQDDSPSQK